ncbi:MAG: phosphonoacetaldehyde hydrolase [Planctomycetota bacterium]
MKFRYSRTYRGKLQAVILDWAGTTQDYGCYAPAGVFVEVFRKHGVEISMSQAREPMGTPKKDHIRMISKIAEVAKKWQEHHGRACSEDDIEQLYREFIPMQMECIADFADLIPGTKDAIARFRKRGLKIGSTTGYNREMTEVVLAEAKRQGFVPDSCVCASDVPAGRPAPWMCLVSAMQMQVHPLESIVKIGDTIPDIEEGLNAGMWSVGVAKTGNEIGLNEQEINALAPEELERRLRDVRRRMYQAGAHYVVDAIGDCDSVLDEIECRLAQGEKP